MRGFFYEFALIYWAAFANAAKLISYVIAVPLAFSTYGLPAAVLVLSAGEAVKYAVLWLFGRREHLGFGRDDLGLTIIFLAAAFLFRELFAIAGLTGGWAPLFPFVAELVAR